MNKISPLTKIAEKLNSDCYAFVKVLIRKPDGSEEWIKKEGEKMDDYEVWDKLFELNYNYSEIYRVDV